MILTYFPHKQKPDLYTNAGIFSGRGLFETVLFDDATFWFRERHVARIRSSAEKLSFSSVPDQFDFDGLYSFLKSKNISKARIKLILPDDEQQASPLSYFFQIFPLENTFPEEISCDLVPHPLRDKSFRQHKTINYGPYLDLMRRCTPGKEFILTEGGFCLETPIANIFAVRGDQLFTPPVRDGILPGIIRSVLMDHLPCQETSIPVEELETYDFLIATNSIREIRLIRSVGHLKFTKTDFLNDILKTFQKLKEAYKKGDFQ